LGNLLAVLAAVSAQLWENFGFSRDDGIKALTPMIQSVSKNLEVMGIPEGVAGPYVRGDIGTVRKHLHAIQNRAPGMLPLYRELALAGLPLALEKGILKPDKADEIRRLFEEDI